MTETTWYQTFFGKEYLEIYHPDISLDQTVMEAEGIVHLLALPNGSKILDLCCGYGRHSIPLARAGYKVTGQDLSSMLLDMARRDAEMLDIQVSWIQRDMRDIPFRHTFDGAINVSASFGYLESDEEDQRVLCQISNALKPGGRFLIETTHREARLRQFPSASRTHRSDDIVLMHQPYFNLLTSRHETKITIIYPGGRCVEHHHSLRLYTLTELVRMFTAANLEVEAFYGGLDGSALVLDSPRLVVIGRKAIADGTRV